MKNEADRSKRAEFCVDVTASTQQSCVSVSVPITAIRQSVIAKIPVTLSEFTLQVNLDSIISLPEPALEIKNVKKNVKITQCIPVRCGGILLPTVLFLKGFVRKNITYATRQCSNAEGVCGDIRHCTVDVPFNCTTNVIFNKNLPEFTQFNTVNEFSYFRTEKLRGHGFAEKDCLLSGDSSEFNQISQEFFNEPLYCDLVSAHIVEFDEFLNRTCPGNAILPFEEREFEKIEEKMVLNITLKVLQNRPVVIPPTPIPPG